MSGREARIAEVGIDSDASLFVKPEAETFPFIYRAAMHVGWDSANKRLFSPPPKEWSYVDWFRQIVAAVLGESGVQLLVGPATKWSNVPLQLRADIEAAQSEATVADGESVISLAEERLRRDAEVQTRAWQRKDALADANQLWQQGRYADYARLLAPFRDELSPAQIKRIEIAKRRAGIL